MYVMSRSEEKWQDGASIEIVWAAGFFDGEGCITYSASGSPQATHKHYLRLIITQTDPEPLLRFAAAVGAGNVLGPYPPKAAQRKPQWTWQVSKEAGQVLDLLRPHLCGPKTRQADDRIERIAEHNQSLRRGKMARRTTTGGTS